MDKRMAQMEAAITPIAVFKGIKKDIASISTILFYLLSYMIEVNQQRHS